MAAMTYDTRIYRGSKDSCNPNLSVTFIYEYKTDENFPTVKAKRNGGFTIDPSFSISISEGFDKNRIFIPGNKYFGFVSIFHKAIEVVKENLYTIFPDVNKTEFEVDSRALERFQTEKALMVGGMTACPAVYSNETNECFPGIRISSQYGEIIVALEDAMQMMELFKVFDPVSYSATMLHFFANFNN